MNPHVGKPSDLHGSAPDTHHTALLLIDVINRFDFDRGRELLKNVLPLAPCIAALAGRARRQGVPVIYINDNFGRWQSNFQQLIDRALAPDSPGNGFVRQVAPEECDYFVLKPKHSGFYQTPLEILLKHLGAQRVILAGVCTNSCILFTANDAYMRDLQIAVPEDCVTACSEREHRAALEELRSMLKADTSISTEVDLDYD